jgi:hypothetical protein
MKLIVITAFSWAHRGVDIQAYAKGDEIETEDQDLIDVSTREGWASAAGEANGEQDEPAGELSGTATAAAPRAGRAKK